MAKALLYWGWDADLIECPSYIAENIATYQRQFDKWISDSGNDHGYWSKDSEGDTALCFDGDAFLTWLNNVVLIDNDEKAQFLKREFVPSEEEMVLPRINF